MSAPATSTTSTARTVAALPVLPNDANISPQLLARLQAVVERIATLDGQRGDALDAALTKRDLVDVGLLRVGRGGTGIEVDNGFSGGWTNIPYLDAMPTPAPPTFETGIGVNFLFWTLPNARGVGATQIFRRTGNFDGTIIAAPVGSMYADLPVEFGTKYYYKIRFVSEKGTPGDWSSEVKVVSEVDPAFVIETLQGQVDESALAIGLRDRVKIGGTFDTAIKYETSQRETAVSALASQINTVSAAVGAAQAAISSVNNTVASDAAAQASAITTVQASVGSALAAVSSETEARVRADGDIVARYTSTAEVGLRTAGFTYGSDGKVSEFYILADRFAVLSTGADDTATTPFIIKGNTTYIKEAMIEDASISTAKIAHLDTTVANIAKATIYNAAIGGQIYSSNYNPGSKIGWSLNQDGSAFFGSNVVFGGRLDVYKADSGGAVSITADGLAVYDERGRLVVKIGRLS